MSATDTAINVTEFVGRAAAFGESALPVARFIAGFFPGGGPVLDAITIAMPIIEKIAAAAPVASKAIEAGRPIIDAIEASGPELMPQIKELFAIAINHDPARPEKAATAADVSDGEAEAFAGTIFSRSNFSPRDPRFSRATQGGQ